MRDGYDGLMMIVEGKGLRDRYLPIAKRSCAHVQQYLEKVRPRFEKIESGDKRIFCFVLKQISPKFK